MRTFIKTILYLIALLSLPAEAERLHGLERMERFDLLPCLLEGTQVRQVSSHDRTGGNDDGFNGTYSYLYIDENGEYVLFDEIGAGCLYRFWMTYGSSPADYSQYRLRFYFDNETTPRLDMSIADFFDGVGAPLEFPMVGPFNKSSHGCYSYLPFPYRARLKITLSGLPLFYNMTYHRYDSPDGIVSWTGSEDCTAVMAQWNAVGSDPKPAVSNMVVSGNLAVASGATGTLFNAVSPGVVQAIRMDPTPNSTNILSQVWLQMNWDGGDPEVDVPLGDFFGSGKDEINVTSLPIGMKTSGDWYCYFPMPFWKSAEIRLVNHASTDLSSLPFEIQYSSNTYSKADTGYFNAYFHESTFTNDHTDFNFIDEQGRGHVVGVSLFMESSGAGGYQDMNYLEGDERCYIDDALSPCIHGTGNEDYFNCGWYFNQGSPSRPYHGNPWKDQFNGGGTNYTQAYRMHLSDIIPFNRSVRFGIEHGHDNASPGTFSSATYFYKAQNAGSGLVQTADLDLGDEWFENLYGYITPFAAVAQEMGWGYEGDAIGPGMVVDDGFHYSGALAEFTVPLVENEGLLLRRRTDQGVGGQKAHVFADDAYVGIWYEADHALLGSTKRWLDSEFMVPVSFTSGKSSVRITIAPLISAPVWNEYRYWAYCIKPFESVVDSDADQLPDVWELSQAPTLDWLGDADFDLDGFSDLQEYIAGTQPTNPASFFKMESDGSFQSELGRFYALQECSNLASNDWTTIHAGFPGNGKLVVPPIDTGAPQAFLRLLVEPQ